MTDPVQLEKAAAQRKVAKRATLDSMRGKKPRRDEFEVTLDPDGEPESFLFVAIRPRAFDDLMTEHQPTEKQIQNAMESGQERPPYNVDTFPPALLAAVCREPRLSVEDWTPFFDDEAWGRGEIGSL